MEIMHRITISATKEADFFKEIKKMGIEYEISPLPGREIGLVHFEISESDQNWGIVKSLIDQNNPVDLYWTSFTPEEIINSKWNRLKASYEWGYPQPETKMKWLTNTFENLCPKCGAGFIQVAPFIIKREPSIGRKHFFSLFWAVTLFCKKEIVKVLEDNQISGYEPLDPIIRSTQEPSKTVTQLIIPEISLPGLIADDDRRNPELCPVCGITKYAYHKRGKMRINEGSLDKDLDFQMSDEWFGSGGADAFREIIVSNRLSRLILEKGWRGIDLEPVELV